jgi:hypothetical protein
MVSASFATEATSTANVASDPLLSDGVELTQEAFYGKFIMRSKQLMLSEMTDQVGERAEVLADDGQLVLAKGHPIYKRLYENLFSIPDDLVVLDEPGIDGSLYICPVDGGNVSESRSYDKWRSVKVSHGNHNDTFQERTVHVTYRCGSCAYSDYAVLVEVANYVCPGD